jgi:2-polyprenyl-3-methyl-5-hydroxy-6-metoxy-1,4-benzoquinol methylase
MFFLTQRRREPEIMDDPQLDAARHTAALRGLARINWISGSSRILWPHLRALAKRLAPQPVRVLDLATGSGDLPRQLWHKARRAGLTLHFDGCDVNPQAVEYAQRCATEAKADVQFFTLDALNQPLPETYQVITTSLFLHHLDGAQAAQLLQRMTAAAREMVLVNDLRRSLGHYLLAVVATRLLSRSPVVHVDGPRSVAAAFTLHEVRHLVDEAGIGPVHLSRHWPYRWLLRWQRPVATGSTL